jgi:23S rRNA (guanosine2251-2'-O)-methyltransferase
VRVKIEGARAVLEAIRAGRRPVHRVILSPGAGSPGLREIEAQATARGIEVSREPLRGLRALAEADPLPEESFEDLLMRPPPRFLIALDRVTDVGNFGSIARTAEAAGVSGLILEHHHAPPLEPGALRASSGALEHLAVGRTPRLASALDLAAKEGFQILAAEPGGITLDRVETERIAGDLILVFGSEDRGLRSSIRERADERVGIPLEGEVASLGVAAAAAYLLLRVAEIRRALGVGSGPKIRGE